jgi:hypothetical protein
MQTITKNSISKHTFLYVVFSAAILLAGCRGDEGPMGPAGHDGIANVNSVIYDVPPQNWTGDVNSFKAILTVQEITSDIYNNGAVLVYKLLNESDPVNKSFNMLPYTSVDGTQITYMDFDVFIGEIDLYLKWVDNGVNDTQAPTTTESYKVIIIQGTPLAKLKTQVNVTSYSAVAKYLGLKETTVIIK